MQVYKKISCKQDFGRKSCNFVKLNIRKMIQRIQSIFMFFAIFSVAIIMYKVPVLANKEEVIMLSKFRWAQIAAFITIFLIIYCLSKFTNKNFIKKANYKSIFLYCLILSFSAFCRPNFFPAKI